MKIRKTVLPQLMILLTASSCALLTPEEYGDFISNSLQSGLDRFTVGLLYGNSISLYIAALAGGAAAALLSFVFFLFHRRDKSWLFLSLSSLFAAGLYSMPFWASLVVLPKEFWSPAMAQTLIMILWIQMYREWCRKALYHRTKLWATITGSVILSLLLIFTLLSGHFPALARGAWAVPFLGVLLTLDALINSFLSFQRKSDRSGIAGALLIIPLAGCAVWLALSYEYDSLLPFLGRYFFSLPALMTPWQVFTTIALVQRRYAREIGRTAILTKMVDEEELQKEKLEEMIASLEQKIEDNARIDDYDLESARRLMGHEASLPLSLPESWRGDHRINASGTEWPILGAWSRSNDILFAETRARHGFVPLLYLARAFETLKLEKPALMLSSLNNRLTSLANTPDAGMWGAYLYFMEKEIICGTAGNVRVYLQKKADGKTIPIRSAEKLVTLGSGLGLRAHSKEDGKPFRIGMDAGDRIILVSVSLTDRELEMSGEVYGQKSLYRVLGSHTSSSPQETVAAILKDFDDFDMGNTEDRQIYAGVFEKI